VNGVPPGPLHRPGQPCLSCHDGSASSEVFSLAGTIFESSDSTKGASGVEVRIIDYIGRQTSVRTNEVGNFYVDGREFEPNWPVWIKVVRGMATLQMTSPVYREGSCSACHQGAGDPSHAEAIHFSGEGKP
jgi:hypothetical protein